jgi:hypothetical protein
LREIRSHRYWNRAWILQEVALANSLRLICGTLFLGHYDVTLVFHSLRLRQVPWAVPRMPSRQATADSAETRLVGISDTSGNSNLMPDLERYISGYRPDILDVLFDTRSTQCSDARDALFSKISLAGNGVLIAPHPNYSVSAHQLYRQFAVNYITRTGTDALRILCHAGSSERVAWENGQPLPSWAPDWTPLDPATLTDARAKSDVAAREWRSALHRSVLRLLDAIEEESTSPPRKKAKTASGRRARAGTSAATYLQTSKPRISHDLRRLTVYGRLTRGGTGVLSNDVESYLLFVRECPEVLMLNRIRFDDEEEVYTLMPVEIIPTAALPELRLIADETAEDLSRSKDVEVTIV